MIENDRLFCKEIADIEHKYCNDVHQLQYAFSITPIIYKYWKLKILRNFILTIVCVCLVVG